MTASLIACAFVSFRSSFFGEGCKNDATHRYNDMDLCRSHWLYESGAFPVCGLCQNPRYEDAWVIQAEHTCTEGDRGWDCMHFEGVSYCDCESESQVAFESANRETAVIPAGTMCEDCEDENEAEVVFREHYSCYECVSAIEAGDQEYKDMLDHSGQY
jgi:hypothetical protein